MSEKKTIEMKVQAQDKMQKSSPRSITLIILIDSVNETANIYTYQKDREWEGKKCKHIVTHD